MNDLTILFPEQVLKTSIGTLTLSPVKMRHWDEFIEIASRWLAFLNAGDASTFNAILNSVFGTDSQSEDKFFASFQAACKTAGEQFYTDATALILMSIKESKDAKDLLELSHAEFFGILTMLWKINKDFFKQLKPAENPTPPVPE